MGEGSLMAQKWVSHDPFREKRSSSDLLPFFFLCIPICFMLETQARRDEEKLHGKLQPALRRAVWDTQSMKLNQRQGNSSSNCGQSRQKMSPHSASGFPLESKLSRFKFLQRHSFEQRRINTFWLHPQRTSPDPYTQHATPRLTVRERMSNENTLISTPIINNIPIYTPFSTICLVSTEIIYL